MSFWPLLTSEQWTEDSKEWIPSDPLYTPEQWRKIKDVSISAKAHLPFSRISAMLIVSVGSYRAAALNEKSDKIRGFKFQSNENRKRLRRAIKVFQSIKGVFSGTSKLSLGIQRGRVKEALDLLENRTMRLCMHDDNDSLANAKIDDVIHWLSRDEKTIDDDDFNVVVDLAINVLGSQKSITSLPGRPKKSARRNALKALSEIWKIMKNAPPSLSTNPETGKITGGFVDFVYAALSPVSDDEDMDGLCDEIKAIVYPAKRGQK